MTAVDVLVAVAIAIGLVGVVVPLLPGSLLVIGAILVWALVAESAAGWTVLVVAAALVGTGLVVKYLVPGRRLRAAGVPGSALLAGATLGVVGFFLVPVVGLVLGFVLGIYLAEWNRLRERAAAWSATRRALAAVGLGVLIELGFALLAAAAWAVGAVMS